MLPPDLSLADAALRVFPHVFLFDGGRYVIATLVMSAVLWAVHRTAWRARIIQTRRAKRADYVRELATSLRTVVVNAAVFTPVLWIKAQGYGPDRFGPADGWMTAAYVVTMLIVHDA